MGNSSSAEPRHSEEDEPEGLRVLSVRRGGPAADAPVLAWGPLWEGDEDEGDEDEDEEIDDTEGQNAAAEHPGALGVDAKDLREVPLQAPAGLVSFFDVINLGQGR
jgi:hypothetical protein